MGGSMGSGGTVAPIIIEIGGGELIDRITILEIKRERMRDPAKLRNVEHELASLAASRAAGFPESLELRRLEVELKGVNARLWDIEDDIRECESRGDFGPAFINLARAVYRNNDRRAALKKSINLLTGARIIEEKSYAEAGAAA